MQRLVALLLPILVVACAVQDPGRLTDGREWGSLGDDGMAADAPLEPVDDTPDPLPVEETSADPTSTLPSTEPGSTAPGSTTPGTPSAPPKTTVLAEMTTTADLNLRNGPSTDHTVLMVMPAGSTVEILDAAAKTGFLNVRFSGTPGWASTKYLEAPGTMPPSTGGGLDGPPSPDNAIARAAASVGFSYWWGGGAWVGSGPTGSTKGSCSGNCPSCSHSGKFGADCSGMVGKAWQFGSKSLEANSHPYSTASFVKDAPGKWSTVSRGALKRGDALVYNSGGSGHVVLWEKGDGWGASTVYECKGCSYGCVHNTRSFASSYKGIRRAGF